MIREPELVAKNIPLPHIHNRFKMSNNFDELKRRAKRCNRCGEWFVTDQTTQAFCATCRGWMGSINSTNYKDPARGWNHGIIITTLLEEMRR